jgi:hypothetical protein
MKLLSIISLIFLSLTTASFAKTIECNTFYQVSWDMPVDIKIKGNVEKTGENSYLITDRYLYLGIDEDSDGYSWYRYEGESESALDNEQNYNPRKYHGHAKFIYDYKMVSLNAQNEWERSFYGYVEFLLPMTLFDSAQKGETFNAVMIMTYIADHWGGTRTLKCTVL